MKRNIKKYLPISLSGIFILLLCFFIFYAPTQNILIGLGGLAFGAILLIIVIGANKDTISDKKK